MEHNLARTGVEKLDDILLIVNADDLGYTSERDFGIFHCFVNGIVSSASLLVNGVSAEGAIKAAHHYGLPVGLHVNLTEGLPVSRPDLVRTLLDFDAPTPQFRGKFGLRQALEEGKIDSREIGIEVQAQLDKFVSMHPNNSLPTHWDGHQHIHVHPEVLKAVIPVFQGSVTRTRVPSLDMESSLGFIDALSHDRRKFYMEIHQNALVAAPILKKSGFLFPSHFIGYTTMGEECTVNRVKQLLSTVFIMHNSNHFQDNCTVQETQERPSAKLLSSLQAVEWMTHPGLRCLTRPLDPIRPTMDPTSQLCTLDEAAAATSTGGWGCGVTGDDFSQDVGREKELQVLTGESHIPTPFVMRHVELLNETLPIRDGGNNFCVSKDKCLRLRHITDQSFVLGSYLEI